jgi:diacylglycerol kinase
MNRLIKSFCFASQGFLAALSGQLNLRIHLTVSFCVILSGFIFRVSEIEWIVLLLCIGLVVGLELMNTAIEELVNMVSPEKKDQAGKIKDIAASAVLWSAIISALVGIIVFAKHIISLFSN